MKIDKSIFFCYNIYKPGVKRDEVNMVILFGYLRRLVAILTALMSLLGIETNTITVDLYANPSSGYSWEYSFDKSGVLALNDSYYTPDPGSILTGRGGGTRHFIFKSVGSGTVRVTFEYVKEIGTERTVASRYIYTYNVATDGTISLYSIQ